MTSATTETAAPTRTTATIASRVRYRARAEPDRVALREKEFGIWQQITWGQYWQQVLDVAHGLLALGVDVGDRVAIHSENRPEWLYVDAATVAVRAMTMGMYPTNPAPEVQYLLENRPAISKAGENLEALVELVGPSAAVGLLAERSEFEIRREAQPYAEDQPTPTQPVDGDCLTSELPRSPTSDWCDHRADAHATRRERDGRE